MQFVYQNKEYFKLWNFNLKKNQSNFGTKLQ
jgi:hypothetical protein